MSAPDSAPALIEASGDPAILARSGGATIAYHRLLGASPGIVFSAAWSDMTGTKALFLEDYCLIAGRPSCASIILIRRVERDIALGTIEGWREDALPSSIC
jgi:hypothetical protein